MSLTWRREYGPERTMNNRLSSDVLVDVILVNYNGLRFLAPCLASLRSQTEQRFRTTLVDNCSTDGSVELVQTEFSEVRILRLDRNYGFCAGCNRGIETTQAPYVALLNNDTEASPGWLGALVGALESLPEAGIGASQLVRIADRQTIDSAGDLFYHHGVAGKRGEGHTIGAYSEPDWVFGACAGAAIYRRSILEDVGLFDEDLFAYGDDTDFSFRAQLRGYACRFVPSAIVYHHVGGTSGKPSAASIRRARRNMAEVLLKNMPGPLLAKYWPQILAYYAAGDISYALRGQLAAVIGARIDNLKRLRRTLVKRKLIQGRRTVSLAALDATLSSRKLAVWPLASGRKR